MTTLRIVSTGIVYRNPVPNIRSRQAFFPSVVEVGDGEIAVSFDRGSAMENADVRSFLTRSKDGGESWSEPKPILNEDLFEATDSSSVRVSRTDDGVLLGLVTFFRRNHPDDGLANQHTDGFVRTEFALVRSEDGGDSWTPPVAIAPPMDWDRFETCSPITVLGQTRYLLPTATWADWKGENPYGMKAIQFVSDDEGISWDRCVDVMDDREHEIAHWEQKQIRLPDGRVFVVCWTHDLKGGKSLKNRYTFSENNGDSFGPFLESSLCGETCTPLVIDGNRVLFVYRRWDQPGLWAHLARFEKETWVPLADEPLWGQQTKTYGLESDNTFEKLAALKFGYPSAARLSNGDAFIVFWCVEDCVTNIRWIRVRVEEDS